MKIIKKISVLALSLGLLLSSTSCVVLHDTNHHDNGKHKGQYKKWPKHHKSKVIIIDNNGNNGNNGNHGGNSGKGKKGGKKK